MRKKVISILLITSLFISSIGINAYGVNGEKENSGLASEKMRQQYLTSRIYNAVIDAGLNASTDKKVELIVISQLDSDITDELKNVGATNVTQFAEGAYRVKIPAKDAYKLAEVSEVVTAGINHEVKLEPIQKQPIVQPQLEYSNEETSIKDMWAKGYTGKDTTVAIIDTGVEPDNELLKMTSDGKLKIIDHQEFISEAAIKQPKEGDVKLHEITPESTDVTIPYSYFETSEDGEYVLNDSNSIIFKSGEKDVVVPEDLIGKKILAGAFSESRMTIVHGDGSKEFFDTNNNEVVDDFAFICVDRDDNGTYEEIIFDTNNDGSFSDEKTMGVYKDIAENLKDEQIYEMENGQPKLDENNELIVKEEFKTDYDKLYNRIYNTVTDPSDIKSKTEFNFVFTRVENERFGSWYANILSDTRGHGTHVAGDAAANGYLSHDFVDGEVEETQTLLGPAKDAQIMDLRVFGTNGGTSEDMYIGAMEYAAVHGADVANMSLGSQPEITDGTSLGAQYADLLTAKYGTLFVISNGNNGPGVNSNGEPGDSWYALTVGAYAPNFYTVGADYTAEDQMWIFSSNGPSDDGRIKPEIVAPGSMISASPMWDIVGADYDFYGTFKDQADNPQVGYARMQGTSMAAPYAAGVAAVLKQAVKEEEIPYHPLLFKEAITKTADNSINAGKYNPVEIGNGMINPVAAYNELKTIKNSSMLPQLLTGDVPSTDWPYNTNDKARMYTLYQDMYIVPNVNYKSDTRMKYVNPSGLYVRNGEIPEEVDVTLPNLTGKDVNLSISKVTYGDGQASEWLTVQESVQINKDETANIKLYVDKAKLNDGINTVLVKMDDPNTYQMDCVVPVVIVKSDELNFDTPSVVSEDNIAAAGYSRQFVNITDDIKSFKVTVEVPEGTNGRVGPYIYFPNGLKYTLDDSYPFVGAMKDGSFVAKKEYIVSREELEQAAMDLTKYNPNMYFQWEGVWEFDAYCSYASKANCDYKITVSTNGVVTDTEYKNIDLAAGNTFDGSINIINSSGEDLNVKSHGFIDLDSKITKERIENFGEFQSMEKLFQIAPEEKNIYHKVKITNASYGEGARVWLYLYKATINPDGSYTLIKPMINKYINVNSYGMESEMLSPELEPGYYVYALFGAMMEDGPVDFDLITQTLNQSDALGKTINLNSSPSIIKDGESSIINYTVKAPAEGGEYTAGVVFEDKDGNVVKRYPINADVSPTNKILEVIQERIPLLSEEMTVNVNVNFPDEGNEEKLYGLDFKVEYDPEEVSASSITRGDIFTDDNSYKVKTEVQRDEQGKEIGVINFAYVFKGKDTDGVNEGNAAKISFMPKQIGKVNLDTLNLLVGNYEGVDKAVRVETQEIKVATPDVNGDGIVDMKDYSRCAYSLGAKKDDGSGRYRDDADVNKDGEINDKDLNYIVEYFNNEF